MKVRLEDGPERREMPAASHSAGAEPVRVRWPEPVFQNCTSPRARNSIGSKAA